MASAALIAEYRAAREAQDIRFESRNGSVSVTDTHTREYREYFGMGEYAGAGVERRVIYRDYLTGAARERRAELAAEHAPVFEPIMPTPSADPLDRAFTRAVEMGATHAAHLIGLAMDGRLNLVSLTGAELAALATIGHAPAASEITRRAIKRASKRALKVAA